MAVNSTFYINAADFETATAVYLDLALTYIAPDGYYRVGTVVRQQSGGILLAVETCAECPTPCGTSIVGSGSQGIYLVNLDVGSIETGAIIIKFDPRGIPDGIRVTYDGVVYNKLSSSIYGVRQSSNPGNFTVVGVIDSDCGLTGNTTNFPTLTEYLYYAPTSSFSPTGNTQSVTIYPGDVQLNAARPGFCVMVIPKPSTIPNLLLIEIVGLCGISTAWDVQAFCPTALPSFSSTNVHETASITCAQLFSNTYYFAKVHTAIDSYVGIYDYVFSDENGEFPLPNGFYLIDNVASPNKVIEVVNGVVVAITDCI